MNSFIFPEDLDLRPTRRVDRSLPPPPPVPPLPPSKKLQQAFPVPATKRSRPLPIVVPSEVELSRYVNLEKPESEVVVSVTRLSLDERSPRLHKARGEKRPSNLTRWNSATLTKTEKEDRQARMALVEADRVAQRQARLDRADKQQRPRRVKLAPLREERLDERTSPPDYGVAYLTF